MERSNPVEPRMKNPAELLPGAAEAVQSLWKSGMQGGVPAQTIQLVHLRASQINGCSFCVDSGWRHGRQSGESEERLFAVAAWRDAPYFNDAERAALALTECVTRLADRPDPVPDEVWDEATRYYDPEGMAALLVIIATTNVFNRLNVPVRQPVGSWG